MDLDLRLICIFSVVKIWSKCSKSVAKRKYALVVKFVFPWSDWCTGLSKVVASDVLTKSHLWDGSSFLGLPALRIYLSLACTEYSKNLVVCRWY